MNQDIFLWPQAAPLRARHLLTGAPSHAKIEAMLQRLYPAAEPVLFSSARAGLRATLVHLGLTRPDLVWCPPYSSHCVFDAIARQATPSTAPDGDFSAALLYHQWGHVQHHSFAPATTLIEDSVDTLFLPGADPCAGGGRFALWSLPKVLACQWGGIVFCRDAADARALRQLRANSPLTSTLATTLQTLLRLGEDHWPLAAQYWHGAEANGGELPGFARKHIAEGLARLPEIIASRQSNLTQLQAFSLAPPPPADRLPCNLPLLPLASLAAPLASGRQLSAGIRSFNVAQQAPNGQWQRVFPLPIHQDICGTDIAELIVRIRSDHDFSLNEPDILR